jgi:hypothetical protein
VYLIVWQGDQVRRAFRHEVRVTTDCAHRQRTLEELDQVFNIPHSTFIDCEGDVP